MGDLGLPGAYLNIVVLNKCRDRARRVARQRALVVESVHASADDVDDEALWTSLQHLPFNHRAAIVLRFHHQMTTAESQRHWVVVLARSDRGSNAVCSAYGRTWHERPRVEARTIARAQGRRFLRITVIAAGDNTMLIWLRGNPAATAEFDAHLDSFEQMLASIRF